MNVKHARSTTSRLGISRKYLFIKTVFFAICCMLTLSSICSSATHRITNNNATNDSPSLHNGKIAYVSSFNGSHEIYYWDGKNTINISNSSDRDRFPSLFAGKIAWDNRSTVYYWNGEEIIEIGDGGRPSLNMGAISYDDYFESYRTEGIYYWNGTTTSVIPGTGKYEKNTSLYNGTIAWESNVDGDGEIYYWDGTSTRKITNNFVKDDSPSLYNGTIAWRSNYRDVLYWDGNTIHKISENLLPVVGDVTLYDGKIAWCKDLDLYYWDGSRIHQITANKAINNSPSLYNGTIAYVSKIEGNHNIYFWDQNLPIIANAGNDQFAMVGDTVTLNASATSAPESTIVSWDWQLVHHNNPFSNTSAAGEIVTLSNLRHGYYTVTLTVLDDNGAKATDTISLTVEAISFLPSIYRFLTRAR